MNNPENYEPDNFSERGEVLTALGKQLYRQCDHYFNLFKTRPLVELDEDTLSHMYISPQLQNFHKTPGELAEFYNSQGARLDIIKRQSFEGDLQLTVYKVGHDEKDMEEEDDYTENYLVNRDGQILAAERQETTEDYVKGGRTVTKSLEIEAEPFLHSLETTFRAVAPARIEDQSPDLD